MLRVGIVGCGGIAERRHGPVLASLNDRVKIGALADLAQERWEERWRSAIPVLRTSIGAPHRP